MTDTKQRKFHLVAGYEDQTDLLPQRSTAHSAGYDFKAARTVVIHPGAIALVPTGVAVEMPHENVLFLYDRSSNPRKRGIALSNSVGVIDADYFGNPDNGGHIFGQFTNITDHPITIERGDAIMQGVFSTFLVTTDDEATGDRVGGFGSTGG